MAAQYIQLNEVVKSMRTFAPFSLEWVAADVKRKKAGKWLMLEKAVLAGYDKQTRAGAPGAEQKALPRSKDPNAIENDTINVVNLVNKDLVKVHLRLITVFNGKRVLY